MQSPRELFIHELSDMFSAEQMIATMLPELGQEAQHPEVQQAFRDHEAETKGHISRIGEAFKLLGERPEQTTCYGAEGMKKEHEALHQEQPSPAMLELANLMGAAKTEHYEIASYTGLVQMARDLGERDVADLLKQNLDEEKEMERRVKALSKQLGKEAKAAAKEREKQAVTA